MGHVGIIVLLAMLEKALANDNWMNRPIGFDKTTTSPWFQYPLKFSQGHRSTGTQNDEEQNFVNKLVDNLLDSHLDRNLDRLLDNLLDSYLDRNLDRLVDKLLDRNLEVKLLRKSLDNTTLRILDHHPLDLRADVPHRLMASGPAKIPSLGFPVPQVLRPSRLPFRPNSLVNAMNAEHVEKDQKKLKACIVEDIEKNLQSCFEPEKLEVIRNANKFTVNIVSNEFAGQSLLSRHRMVYKCLEREMPSIHALSIRADTP